ncbi:type II toxin-antitoxin system VapC family toxin [Caulobacter segnis]|uniref:type II toxin-antitoxin system VapC family toxin n=1 Tax=Caulobacter segnis TaxID=88688 RepID=UPI00240F1F95|nr:type II toxin-antitoxin system VapC family toxin [Caulobacter segnis]MDG2522528.1 type II toxin-antitoxin system VapC family toxin [Caulobacter segnis]
MKLLVDTHLLLWAAAGQGLSEAALHRLETADTLMFSAASIWEIGIKSGLGRADFNLDASVFRRELLDNEYEELAITGAHAAAVSSLPDLHRDPFDRILIAQAIVEGVTLVTADRTIAGYPGPILAV